MGIKQFFRVSINGWTVCLVIMASKIAQITGDDIRHELSPDSSYFFYQRSDDPRDCKEASALCSSMNPSGVHYIRPEGYPEPFEVYCDDGGEPTGWTVIQTRHMNGSVHFDRNWESYKQGFGFLSGDFWIGIEKLSFLTNQRDYELLIEMTTYNGTVFSASYNDFRIGDEHSNYRLINLTRNAISNAHVTWCPIGTYYGDCTCGRSTCEDPDTCINTCIEGQSASCVPCPDGFYVKDGDCVPQRECGCYVEEESRVIPEGESYTSLDCSRKWLCSDGEMIPQGYTTCGTNSVCDLRNGIRKCYCAAGYQGNDGICVAAVTVSDCQDLYDAGIRGSGIYTINPTNWPGPAFEVFCNMSGGGGWTVFQRRVDGTVDFNIYWDDYEQGFGTVDHEYWLGNAKLHYLTEQRNYQLRIDVVLKDGSPKHALYDSFGISGENDNYRLSLGTFSGDIGVDRFAYNHNQQFTTRDRDNDAYSSYNCAIHANYFRGGWWYNYCSDVNLNGIYGAGDCSVQSITWRNEDCSLCNIKYTEMKIRPI